MQDSYRVRIFHKNSVIWLFVTFFIVMLVMVGEFINSPVCNSASASATLPSDFCLRTDVNITFTGGGSETNLPVRYVWDTTSLILQTGLNEQAWDIRAIIGSFSNEVFIEVQDLNSLSTIVWVILPEISNNQTRTVTKYTGTNELFRDSGVFFSGSETLTIADNATLDTSGSGNLQIDLWMDNSDETARNEVIFDKRDGSNGYEIQFADVASVLMLQFEINTGSCSVAWNTAWTDNHNKFTFVYANSTAGNDAFIRVNDIIVATCDIDEGTVGNNTLDLVIGGDSFLGTDELTETAIRTVTMFDNGTRILKFTFDPIDVTETVSVNPFEGIIDDHSGNNFDAAYVYDRDQSGIAFVLEPSQLVSTTVSDQVIADPTPINVLGNIIPFNPALGTKNTTSFIYTWFIMPVEDAAPADWMAPTFMLLMLGFIIGGLIFLSTGREISPLSVMIVGFPIMLGGLNGWTPWWFIFMWWLIQLSTWWGMSRAKQATP